MKEIKEVIYRLKSSSFQENIYSAYIEDVIDAITYLEEYSKLSNKTKGKINQSSIISETSLDKFNEKLKNAIIEMQNKNMIVEVQYQNSAPYFSALILGREKE